MHKGMVVIMMNDAYSDQESDDGLMVSFPKKPRKPLHHSIPSSDEDSVTRSVGSPRSTRSNANSEYNSLIRRQSQSQSQSHSQSALKTNHQSETKKESKRKEKDVRKGRSASESIKTSKEEEGEGIINPNTAGRLFKKETMSDHFDADNDTDTRPSVSCSSISDDTRISVLIQHENNPSVNVENNNSHLKMVESAERSSHLGVIEHFDVDHHVDVNGGGPSISESSQDSSSGEETSTSKETESGSDSDSDSGSESESESESELEVVSTSGGIPYPTASKNLVYYGWGESTYSESNYSQDETQYRSSQDGSTRSNRMLFAEFPDRQRCAASLTESQATGSRVEEVAVEDEYDPKRPWKKRPLEFEFDADERSEKSVAMSALSASDAGTVFVDTTAKGLEESNNQIKNSSKASGVLENGEIEKLGLSPGQAKSVKSAKSTKSSLNSDVSELNVAKEALRISSKSLANVDRQLNPRSIMAKADSEFTLSTQSFRKPEPFRPGPGTAATGISQVASSNTLNTLEHLYRETSRDLGVPLPPNPAPQPRHRKLRTFSSMSLISSSPSLPSIVENPLSQDFLLDPNFRRHYNGNNKQISDLTLEPNHSNFIMPESRRRVNSLDSKIAMSADVNLLPMDRRISAMTMPDMNEEALESYRGGAEPINRRTSNGDVSVNSSSVNTEEELNILRTSAMLGDQHESGMSSLFRLDEIDDEDGEKTQEYNDHSNALHKTPLLPSNSDQFILAREDSSHGGPLELSIADSSSDEEEQRRPITRRPSGFQQATNSFTYRRYTMSNKCTHYCRRRRQKCSTWSSENRRFIGIVAVSTIFAIASFAILFVFVISNDRVPENSSQSHNGGGNPPSNEISTRKPVPTSAPVLTPSRQFTMWPTALDTYTRRYPPPP